MLRRWKKVQLQGSASWRRYAFGGRDTGKRTTTVLWYRRRARDESQYRYDGEGYPLGKTTISSQNTLSRQKPSADPRKAGLHGSQPGVDDRQVGNVTQNANMMRTRTLLTAGLLSSMRALSRQCPTITPLKIVSITTKPGAVRSSVTAAPRVYCAVGFRSVEPDVLCSSR